MSDSDSAQTSTATGQLPAGVSADAQQAPQVYASEQQGSQPDQNTISAQATSYLQRNSSSRWQRLRSRWGSQHTRDSAADRPGRGRQSPRPDNTGHREVLRNVKAVVPHLSDEVILVELERTLDANQAVENLLSRM